MSYTAAVVDGVLQQNTSGTSGDKSTSKSSNELDKDAFLQLLVAEMKYQDPLEASNNSTEYISQLATFSELEGMKNLESTADDLKASDLIGKTVILDVDDTYVYGQVDYVEYESGTAKLNVNGSLYSLEDLYRVIDATYLSAYNKASTFVSDYTKLPTVGNLSLSDADAVEKLRTTYDAMSDYEKSFIADEIVKGLEKYEEKIAELKKEAGITDDEETEDGTGDKDDENADKDDTEKS